MDKWEEITHRIQQSILAEEPEAAVSAAFQYLAELGRTMEQISADLDRLATAAEKANEPYNIEAVEEPAPMHDL